jgi:hypothetical protein
MLPAQELQHTHKIAMTRSDRRPIARSRCVLTRHERKLESVASDRTVDSDPCDPAYSVHDGGVFKSARTLTIADAWLGQLIAASESGL